MCTDWRLKITFKEQFAVDSKKIGCLLRQSTFCVAQRIYKMRVVTKYGAARV